MIDTKQIEQILGIELTWYQKQMLKIAARKPYMYLVYPRHIGESWLRKEMAKMLELNKEEI